MCVCVYTQAYIHFVIKVKVLECCLSFCHPTAVRKGWTKLGALGKMEAGGIIHSLQETKSVYVKVLD